MMVIKIFITISSLILAIASQKLVSRILLLYESIHSKRDIFYDKLVLIFFMNIVAKPYGKRLTMEQLTPGVGNLFYTSDRLKTENFWRTGFQK